jgi:hypothetical protein
MGRKPIEAPRPLEFGQASHAGFAAFYQPATWEMTLDDRRPLMVAAAVAAFKQSMISTKARFLELTGADALEDKAQEEFLEDMDLGPGMLMHYFDYVQRHNLDRFRPITVEASFEVDIFTPAEIAYYFPELLAAHPEGVRIVYRGRLDALVEDEWGEYWIVDWKTTARMRDNMAFLEVDEQLPSYNWAMEHILGIKIAGNMYAEIYKAYPQLLPENKVVRLGRRFSVNKQNPTSHDIVVAQLTAEGEPLELYEDYLNFLLAEGITYVRRTPMHRNRHELREMGERIKMEVREQLNPDLLIYPSPSPFKCDGCPVRPVCIGMNDGSDVQYILNTYTTKEMRTNA